MGKRTIYLVRHGEPELPDKEKRYIGQTDLPLSRTGRDQAEALRQMLAHVQFTALFSSDLSRALETAQIINGEKNIPLRPLRELREIALGEWEGCTFEEIRRQFPAEFLRRGHDIYEYRIPGGESFADCSRRVNAVFAEIDAATHGDILIVGHAGANRLLLCQLLGVPAGNLFRLGQDYGCLNLIRSDRFLYQVRRINCSCGV